MNIVIIDNYDSFTYNLVHMIEDITGRFPDVYRNDEIGVDQLEAYDMIVLSPGPGIPDEAGILKEVIDRYASKKPMFGVCLGLQAITEVFGGSIVNLDKVFHGVSTTMEIRDEEAVIYKGMPKKFEAARYHSWIAAKEGFPKELKITATDEEGSIMSLQHEQFPLSAVQFHPESILTPTGKIMLENFINAYKEYK